MPDKPPEKIWIDKYDIAKVSEPHQVDPDYVGYTLASQVAPPADAVAECVEGESMMHGSQPYRWCATHNDLMLRCEKLKADAVETAREIAEKAFPTSMNSLTVKGLMQDIAAALAAEKEKVWEQVGVVLSGFTSREIRKVDLIAALERGRQEDKAN